VDGVGFDDDSCQALRTSQVIAAFEQSKSPRCRFIRCHKQRPVSVSPNQSSMAEAKVIFCLSRREMTHNAYPQTRGDRKNGEKTGMN
jgi:hypothetical protein